LLKGEGKFEGAWKKVGAIIRNEEDSVAVASLEQSEAAGDVEGPEMSWPLNFRVEEEEDPFAGVSLGKY